MFAVWERLHDGDQGPQGRARGEMALPVQNLGPQGLTFLGCNREA